MEKPLYPSSVMRITQGYNEGSHKDSYAIDEAGLDSTISKIKAPFTGIIKKIYQNDANEVWLESVDKVEYPDGTIDYMTILFAHANDVSNLFVGQRINKNEEFYSEGTKGQATGNHCHIECGQGKFTGSGWHQNASGYWSINNGKKPEECLWINDSIKIINNYNYEFKKIEPEILTEEEPLPNNSKENTQENTQQSNETTNNIKLIFTCPKTDLYGIYLKKDDQLYLKKKEP